MLDPGCWTCLGVTRNAKPDPSGRSFCPQITQIDADVGSNDRLIWTSPAGPTRQTCRPSGAFQFFSRRFPGLTPRAIPCRPSGAGSQKRRKPAHHPRKRASCGGGAIFNIVGHTDIHAGRMLRANNVEGGSSREPRADTCRVRRRCHLLHCLTPRSSADPWGASGKQC